MKNKFSLFFFVVSVAFINAQVPDAKLDELVKEYIKDF